jgi:hypothetical protein
MNQPSSEAHVSMIQASEFDLEQMVGLTESIQSSQRDELTRYLDSSECDPSFLKPLLIAPIGPITRVTIRSFWKDHQHEFPALAKLARDVLLIPATGAGVERLFNSARDVCTIVEAH